MADFDLDALIRASLDRSREADPHVIARRLIARIPDEHLRAALAECLGDRVRHVMHLDRMRSAAPEVPSPAGRGRSRWEQAAPLLRQRYCVAGEWKLLGDCTADDCDLLADDYARRAAQQAAVEARFRRLAAQLRASGASTVSDLGQTELGEAA